MNAERPRTATMSERLRRGLASARPAPATATPPRGTALRRLPLLLPGLLALVAGVAAGLARMGWPMPAPLAAGAPVHGPLMLAGFFGVVIALERAVALGRRWAFAAPAAAGVGTLALLALLAPDGPWLPQAAALALAGGAFVVSAAVLLVATLAIWRRQREGFVLVLALGAAAALVGHALWAAGAAPLRAVPWWLSFLVLTIAGERLELSRLLPRPPRAARQFTAVVALGLGALVLGLAAPDAGARLLGLSWMLLAMWGLRWDLARRTVRQRGLPRFVALCLLSGYGWLLTGGALALAFGLPGGGPAYDAAVHALGLGFVFAMVFGHAPVILPALLRVPLPWHPVLYAPLAALHATLALRLAGDAAMLLGHAQAGSTLARVGAMGSALALAAFVGLALRQVRRGLSAHAGRAGRAPRTPQAGRGPAGR
jgi:hypothetical protein